MWRRWRRSCGRWWGTCSAFSAPAPARTTATRSSSCRWPCTACYPERFRGSFRWIWTWSTGPTSGNCLKSLTTSTKELLLASPERCSLSIGISSGSTDRSTPRPELGTLPRTGCPVSTVGCCCWTWRPCASPSSTTVSWSRRPPSAWRTDTTSRGTWAIRTSSRWWAWSTRSCSMCWIAPGTGSSAPGGAITGTATSLTATSVAMATSRSTTATAIRPSPRSRRQPLPSCCRAGGKQQCRLGAFPATVH